MVLLGEGAVGKTAIRERYLGRGFTGKYTMTLGADFALKRITIDDTLYVTQIWDLAGQSGFVKTRKLYYGGAMAGLLVFDINNPVSFEKLDVWINEIRDNVGELIPLILIGNKSDLRGISDDQVSSQQGKAYAKTLSKIVGYRVPYIETSALDGSNIDIAFRTLISNVAAIISGEAPNYDPDNVDESVDILASEEEAEEETPPTEVESIHSSEEIESGSEDNSELEVKRDRWNIPQIVNTIKPMDIEDTRIQLEDQELTEGSNATEEHVDLKKNLFPTKYKEKIKSKRKPFRRKNKYRK